MLVYGPWQCSHHPWTAVLGWAMSTWRHGQGLLGSSPVASQTPSRHVHTLSCNPICYRAKTTLITLFYRYQCPRPTLCARPDRIPTATKSQCQWSHLALRHITDRTQSTAYTMRLSVKICLVMLVINVLISH